MASHHFNCVVDTTEMAKEVKSVSNHVDATTTAVVGMQAAVIKAQNDGAQRVCTKVNQGFYAMIHSQISQKMAKLQSQVDAQLMRLNQQRKQLTGIRKRMERDYQMLAARYTKLFTGLNRNLLQRITELDRPILDFATTDAELIINRSNQMVSTVPIGQSESIRLSQKVTASNLKYRAARAVDSIESFIADSNRLKAITDRILLSRPLHESSATLSVPVCLVESNYDPSDCSQTDTYVSQIGISEASRRVIEGRIDFMFREGSLDWQQNSSIDPEITNRFRQMVADSGLDQRRKDTMLKMFDSHPFETL